MARAKIDFLTFVQAQNFLDNFQTPDLHKRICIWLESTQNEPDRLLQVFRGAGKSHLIALYVVWLLLNDPNTTIIVMSAVEERAADMVGHIKNVVQKNPLTKHMRGNGMWSRKKFFINRTQNTRNASVCCSSLESDNVGSRCDVMIIDDLETDKNSVTSKQREDMRAAIAEFMTIAQKQRTYIGTPHALDSVYTHLRSLNYPTLVVPWENGIWLNHPAKLFDQEWADRYIAQNPKWKWNSQYLLVPDSPSTTLINTDMIHSYKDELVSREIWGPSDSQNSWLVNIASNKIVDFAAYWDPATGLQGRDKSTFAVVYKDETNNVYLHRLVILPPIHPELGFGPQCDRIVRECEELFIGRVIVEQSVNPVLDTELKNAARKKHHWLMVKREPRTRNKTEYIGTALEPLVASSRFYVHASIPQEFYNELKDFPNGKHDDCIDATAGAINNLRGDRLQLNGSKPIMQRVNTVKSFDFNKGTKLQRFV